MLTVRHTAVHLRLLTVRHVAVHLRLLTVRHIAVHLRLLGARYAFVHRLTELVRVEALRKRLEEFAAVHVEVRFGVNIVYRVGAEVTVIHGELAGLEVRYFFR